MNKLNHTIDSRYDIFNSSSEFFNDICSTFTSENGTDVIIKDRQKDYYQNISFCLEGCDYNGFDRPKNQIKCQCNYNNNNDKNNKKFGNEINNLFSNSNLNVLKCLYLNNNFTFLLNNYGNSIFLICEIGEIFFF